MVDDNDMRPRRSDRHRGQRPTRGGSLFGSRGGSGDEAVDPGRVRDQRRRAPRTARKAPAPLNRLEPESSSKETAAEARRRRARSSRIVDPETRKRKRRRAITIAVVVVALLLVSGGVAAALYVRDLQAKIGAVAITDPTLAAQMEEEAPPPGDPFYMLLMGDDRRPGEKRARSDTLIVARIDPKAKRVQMISIPRDTRVEIPGHGTNKINAAAQIGGPELAIKTVREWTGLPITKYLTVDFEGLRYVVDAMGGVWIDVPQKIDDNRTHTSWGRKTRVIEKGYQKLDGHKALTFVRARHPFADGDFSRMKNQQLFLKALVKQGLQLSNVFNAPKIVNAISSHIRTNMTLQQIIDLVRQFKGMKDTDIEGVSVPGGTDYINGISYVIADESEMEKLVARMKRGEPLKPAEPAKAASTTNTIDPATIKITVRNGAGVSGLAKKASDFLTKTGFKVVESGNANQFVYGKTLVVFKKGFDTKAGYVADELGFGSVVPAAGLYDFKGDIMVVVGKDWRDPLPKPSARR